VQSIGKAKTCILITNLKINSGFASSDYLESDIVKNIEKNWKNAFEPPAEKYNVVEIIICIRKEEESAALIN